MTNAPIRIRPASETDRPQILMRIEEVFGPVAARQAESLWHWQWHRDPRLPEPGYRGVVADWSGQLIAVLGTQPAGLHLEGRPVEAWWFTDALMHWGLTRQALRAHRRSGAPALPGGLIEALFMHPSVDAIQLGKHVSDPLVTIGLRIGYAPMDHTGSLHRRISIQVPLARALGARLASPLSAAIDPLLGPNPRPRLPVQPYDGPFDARFDRFWDAMRQAYPAICRRDAALLDWRYRQHPEGPFQVLILEDAAGLRGYTVIRAAETGGRRRGKILDLLTAPDDDEARAALLAAAVRALRRLKVERAECFYCGADLERQLRRCGFTPKTSRLARPRPLYQRHLPASGHGLYVTQGDGDGG